MKTGRPQPQQNPEKTAVNEVRNAVRLLQTTYKQVQAYQVARELAEKKLAAEEEKLRVGLSTNYVVLQYQRDLGTARVGRAAGHHQLQRGPDRPGAVHGHAARDQVHQGQRYPDQVTAP